MTRKKLHIKYLTYDGDGYDLVVRDVISFGLSD